MPKYYVIANPAAGRGASHRHIGKVREILDGYGLYYHLTCTERPWHAAQLTEEAITSGFDVVVAMGGDGTVNEVINGLMHAEQAGLGSATLGVLCAGGGNDFAYGVDVPTDLEEGCHALATMHRHRIDIGRFVGGLYPEGRYFANGVGIGFDATVAIETLKMTRLRGFPAYGVAALKTIFLYYQAPYVTVEWDGESTTQRLLMISVMNGKRLGGGFLMAPNGRPDDGLYDLLLAREVSRPRIFGLIFHFIRGTQATQAPIWVGHARRVTITALDGVLPAHADGEILCLDGTRLELELLPQRIEIICRP
jgi:YegS/Rv2252/BmrU family lipid kinase